MAGRNRKKVSKYNKNVEWKAGVYTRRSFDDLEDTESDSIFNQKELISSFLETEENLCDRKDECITLLLWEKLDKAINDVVDSITLQDLIDWNNKK